ncbi:MAG: hypothetical protein ACFFG0_49620 [Candidatus Thorarchaeota archaeon]
MIGFQLAIPIKFQLINKKVNSLLCTLLATDPNYRNQWIAYRVSIENKLRALDSGIDILFNFQFKPAMNFYKSPRIGVMEYNKYIILRKILDVQQRGLVKKPSFLIRTYLKYRSTISKFQIDKKFDLQYTIKRAGIHDLNKCYAFIKEINKSKRINRIWTKEELKYQLFHNFSSTYLLLNRNYEIVLILNFYVLNLLGYPNNKIAVIDLLESRHPTNNILITNFLLKIEQELRKKEIFAIGLVPSLFEDVKPFLRAGFVYNPFDKVTLYYHKLNNNLSINDFEGLKINTR